MRFRIVFPICFTLQVFAIAPNHQETTIKHEEIKGFMPAMTMPYQVKEPKVLDGIAIVDATGRLVKVFVGNEWTPEEILENLRTS